MKIIDINGNQRECQSVVPDPNFPGYMKVTFESATRKGYAHSEWYPLKDFVKNNPALANLANGVSEIPKEELGIVSSADENSLTDKNKDWEKNIFAGYPLWISRGKGEGQTRDIISNSKDSLVINEPWETIPNKSSQYLISQNVHDPQIMGNTLPAEEKINLETQTVKPEK